MCYAQRIVNQIDKIEMIIVLSGERRRTDRRWSIAVGNDPKLFGIFDGAIQRRKKSHFGRSFDRLLRFRRQNVSQRRGKRGRKGKSSRFVNIAEPVMAADRRGKKVVKLGNAFQPFCLGFGNLTGISAVGLGPLAVLLGWGRCTTLANKMFFF